MRSISFRKLAFVLITVLWMAPRAYGVNVEQTLARVQILELVSGATVDEQTERLTGWAEQHLRSKVKCEVSYFTDSKVECLIGLRNFVLGMLATAFPPPEMLDVRIVDGSGGAVVDFDAAKLKLEIPYSWSRNQVSAYLLYQLKNPHYAERMEHLTRIADLVDELQRFFRVDIEVSPALRNLDALSGLYKLALITRNFPSINLHGIEAIKLTTHFQPMQEEDLRWKIGLDIFASSSDMRRYLLSYSDDSRREQERFYDRRKSLETIEANLKQKWNISKVACSPNGGLSQLECLQTLVRLQSAFENPQIHLPKIDFLVVADDSSVARDDFYSDPSTQGTVFLVRGGSMRSSFYDFFFSRGWIIRGENR